MRGHQPRRIGLDVDQLAPEHVLVQQHLPHTTLEAAEAELLPRQPHGSRLERCDPVGRHEQLAAADPRLHPRHRRIAAVGQPHDQVFDATEPLARPIQQRTAQKT